MATSAPTNSADSSKFSEAEVRAIALLLQQRVDAGSELTFSRSQVAILVTANSELLKGKTAAEGQSAMRLLALEECRGETAAQVQVCAGLVASWWRAGLIITIGVAVIVTGVYIATH